MTVIKIETFKKSYSEWSCKERGEIIFDSPHSTSSIAPRRWYQRDIDQIIYSTVFRKMQGKSQLLSSQDPRCRTRLVHTLEVARIAREIGERLDLDTPLIEGIALSHDLANSAYGSVGNRTLSGLTSGCVFKHEPAGSLMVQTLAATKITHDKDKGFLKKKIDSSTQPRDHWWNWSKCPFRIYVGRLGKTYFEYAVSPEVLNGIMCHTDRIADTLEGQVVRASDNFAYMSQDIGDLMEAKILEFSEFQKFMYEDSLQVGTSKKDWKEINAPVGEVDLKRVFSRKSGERVGTMIERYVIYNLRALNEDRIEKHRSDILGKEIPILKVDSGLEFVSDFMWKQIIEPCYTHHLIDTAASLQELKIKTVFAILKGSDIVKKNESIRKFMKSLEGSRFQEYDEDWKIAYFISHLSADEITNIIDHYHQRDLSFDIDIKGDAIYPDNNF